ncbi:hypothetical protein HY468_00395, partial [Candidatus Roizmanbacteria bacterium]|nr:hypothetical protein [Candidatus Roizmanbacteria bacterium]
LIEGSGFLTRFFIEQVGGCDLFNIKFSGSGSKCIWPTNPDYQTAVIAMEKNYTDFRGFTFVMGNQANLESINTSTFIIRITSFTYNILSAVLLLRYIILWFFLIVSPFLALLLPFMFIRNTGWVWIGEFFRWLFYGPLVALFIAGTARIWKAGIPFTFDFSRINTQPGQVYPTAISILYGGPAQTLTQTNSANYVDTYAEYVIALIMLWAAILLPWLLLRIFRDYCCDVLKDNQATLKQILGKFQNFGAPGGPSLPSGKGMGRIRELVDLPFRKITPVPTQEQEIATVRQQLVKQIEKGNTRNISTGELKNAFNLNVRTLTDLGKVETSPELRSTISTTLKQVHNPTSSTSTTQQTQYFMLQQELKTRASHGDREAARILQAGDVRSIPTGEFMRTPAPILQQLVQQQTEIREKERITVERITTETIAAPTEKVVSEIARKNNIPEQTVRTVLTTLPHIGGTREKQIQTIAQQQQIPVQQVATIVSQASQPVSTEVHITADMLPAPLTSRIKTIAEQTNTSETLVTRIVDAIPKTTGTYQQQVERVAQQLQITTPTVQKVVDRAVPKHTYRLPKQYTPTVSIDEYEEVKDMWTRHYREAEVPISSSIGSREEWVAEEIQKLTNLLNLLISPSGENRETGLKQVMELLPFLLLGEFTDAEIVMYVKAKLEAAKHMQCELTEREKTTEQIKKEQEEFISIPVIEKPKKEENVLEQALTTDVNIEDTKKGIE